MIDLFCFPDCYKVKKKTTVSHYLSTAAITETEKETIRKYVKNISFLYDIKCSDKSELIIIAADVENVTINEQLEKVARGIASSIPYDVLVAVFVGNNVRLFSFVTEKNTVNDNRKTIKNVSSTDFFTADHPEPYIVKTLAEIKTTPFIANSSAELLNNWFRIIKSYRKSINEGKKQYCDDKSFYEDQSEYDLSRESFIQKRNDFKASNILRKQSVRYLSTYAHLLFLEYKKALQFYRDVAEKGDFIEVDKDDWLTLYIGVCNKILIQEFDAEITEKEEELIQINYYELDDPEDTKTFLRIPLIEKVQNCLDDIYVGVDPFSYDT